MNTKPDIVVTGMGLVTNLGQSPHSTWAGVVAGTRAMGRMSAIEQQPIPDKGGAQAVDLPATYLPELQRESRYLRFAIDQALVQSGALSAPPQKRAAIFGTTLHGTRAGGRYLRTQDPRTLQDFLPSRVINKALEGLNIQGPLLTTCSACSSGLASIGLAMTLLAAGEIDVAIAGGYDPISEYSYAGFESLRLVAASTPRPFSKDRDGLKIAEGYGVLVLERAHSASARGVEALARIAAVTETSDAFHLTLPHPDGRGAAIAIRSALTSSDTAADAIDLLCAHATATPNNDAAEYAALESVFGASLPDLPVTALKSHVGHTLGAAGTVELILALHARQNGMIPAVAGDNHTDPAFPNLNVVRAAVHRPIRASLNLSLGFGGSNACALVLPPRTAPSDFSPLPLRQVVVTAMGIVLPNAIGTDAFRLLASEQSPTLNSKISDEQLEGCINARRVRRMSEYVKLVLAAANQTCRTAGISENTEFLQTCGAILASTHGSSGFCNDFYSQVVREGIAAANPVLFAEGVPNAASAQLSLALGLCGGCQTLLGSRSALIDAINLAAMRIGQGACDRMFVGAGEEQSIFVDQGYATCSTDWQAKSCSCAVMFLLESLESATARGAPILATFVTGGWCANGVGSLRTLLDRLPSPTIVAGPWSQAPSDLRALRDIRGIAQVSSIKNAPELFSVGPGASLALALSDPLRTGGRLGLFSTEFCGDAAATILHLSSGLSR